MLYLSANLFREILSLFEGEMHLCYCRQHSSIHPTWWTIVNCSFGFISALPSAALILIDGAVVPSLIQNCPAQLHRPMSLMKSLACNIVCHPAIIRCDTVYYYIFKRCPPYVHSLYSSISATKFGWHSTYYMRMRADYAHEYPCSCTGIWCIIYYNTHVARGV